MKWENVERECLKEKKGKAKKNRRRKRQERQRLEEKNTVISEAAAIPEVDWLPEEGEPVGRSRSPNLSDEDEPLPAGKDDVEMAQISIANPINIIYDVEQLELEWIEEEKKGKKRRNRRKRQQGQTEDDMTVKSEPELLARESGVIENSIIEDIVEMEDNNESHHGKEEDEYDSEEEDEYDSEEEDEDDSEEEDEDSEQDEEDSEEQEEEDSEHEEKDEKNPEDHKKSKAKTQAQEYVWRIPGLPRKRIPGLQKMRPPNRQVKKCRKKTKEQKSQMKQARKERARHKVTRNHVQRGGNRW
ncbi:glutamic acid-rich protein-like [Macrobrachium nipponense]|uniref:glutamic acid-rich protein-like n=1 Tax=Macrobrachium nipponense TaxID=159736 RepID=UPI0030C8B1EF